MHAVQLHMNAVKLSNAPLCVSYPQATWVIKSQKILDEFEIIVLAALDSSVNTDQLRQRYGFFRREVLAQFYKVDSALNTLCSEIIEIGKPLNALLKEIPNAG